MIKTTLIDSPKLLADGRTILNVVFVDEEAGTKREAEVIVSSNSVESIKAAIRHERDKSVSVKSFSPGELDVEPTLPTIPVEDPAKQLYYENLRKFKQLSNVAQIGIDVSKFLVVLREFLISNFVDGYEVFF